MSISDVDVVQTSTILTVSWTSNIPQELAKFYGFELVTGGEKTTKEMTQTEETHEFSGLQPDQEYSISLTIYRTLNGTVQLLPGSTTDVGARTLMTTTPAPGNAYNYF